MKRIELTPGDYFNVSSDSGVATGINIFQRLYSADRKAKYSHSGIITSEDGDTFEAKRTINNYHLSEYLGKQIMIVHLNEVVPAMVKNVIHQMQLDHEGIVYPAWRTVFHALGPWVASRIGFGKRFLVCSEVVAKFLFLTGARHEVFRGTTPDKLADEARDRRSRTVIGEGELRRDSDGFFIKEVE